MDRWRHSEFLDSDDEPLGPLANLVDIILVFSCGLIAALVAISPDLQQRLNIQATQQEVSLGKELPEMPDKLAQQVNKGVGYESLGTVYRDPKTGKLILIGQ